MVTDDITASKMPFCSAGKMPSKTRVDKAGLHAEFARDGGAEIDVKAGVLAAFGRFKWRVSGVRADAQLAALAHAFQRLSKTRNWNEQQEQERGGK